MNRTERIGMAVLLAMLLLVHVQVIRQRGASIGGYDGQYYFATLRSLVFDRDFDYRNELESLTIHPENLHPAVVPSTGRIANKYGVGYAVISLVPYVLVHAACSLASAVTGHGARTTGYELPYQVAATSAHVVVGWLALLLTYRLARRYLGLEACSRALVLTLLGTPLLFYICDSACMAHAAGAFAVALLISCTVVALENQSSRMAWVGIGAAAGLAVTLRFSSAVFLVIPAGAFIPMMRVSGTRPGWLSLARGPAIAAVSASPFLFLQMLQWKSVFGSWLAYSYGDEGFNWLRPELLGIAFSHRHGLGFYSPVSVLGLAGLVWLVLRKAPAMRSVAGPLLLSCIALWYLNAAWWCWWFGHGFGARAFVEASPAVMLGLAGLLSIESKPARSVVITAAWAGTVWTILLLVLWYSGAVAPDGGTTFPEVVEALRRVVASRAL